MTLKFLLPRDQERHFLHVMEGLYLTGAAFSSSCHLAYLVQVGWTGQLKCFCSGELSLNVDSMMFILR